MFAQNSLKGVGFLFLHELKTGNNLHRVFLVKNISGHIVGVIWAETNMDSVIVQSVGQADVNLIEKYPQDTVMIWDK